MILADWLTDAGSISYPPHPCRCPFLPNLLAESGRAPAVQKSGTSSNDFPIVLQKDKHEGYGFANSTIKQWVYEMRNVLSLGP